MKYLAIFERTTYVFAGIGGVLGMIVGASDSPYPHDLGARTAQSVVGGVAGALIGGVWPIVLPAVVISTIVKFFEDESNRVGMKKGDFH